MAPSASTGAHTVPSSGTGAQTVLAPGAIAGAQTGINTGAKGSANGSRGATPSVSGAAPGQTMAPPVVRVSVSGAASGQSLAPSGAQASVSGAASGQTMAPPVAQTSVFGAATGQTVAQASVSGAAPGQSVAPSVAQSDITSGNSGKEPVLGSDFKFTQDVIDRGYFSSRFKGLMGSVCVDDPVMGKVGQATANLKEALITLSVMNGFSVNFPNLGIREDATTSSVPVIYEIRCLICEVLTRIRDEGSVGVEDMAILVQKLYLLASFGGAKEVVPIEVDSDLEGDESPVDYMRKHIQGLRNVNQVDSTNLREQDNAGKMLWSDLVDDEESESHSSSYSGVPSALFL